MATISRFALMAALLSWIAAVPAPAADVSFPVYPLAVTAEGEDEVVSAYFDLDGIMVELTGVPGGERYTRALIHAPDQFAPPERIDAPTGRRFDADRVHASDDHSVVILPLAGQPARAFLVEVASGRMLGDFDDEKMEITADRVTLTAVDQSLADRLALIVERAPWRDRVWEEHYGQIDRGREVAGALLAIMSGEYVDQKGRAELIELLARPTRAIAAETLVGDWRVRSLKGDTEGLFVYPFFDARFSVDEDGLTFRKYTGSQRRSGRLWPYGDGESWVFAGGATVNEDAPRDYSRAAGRFESSESDSVGRLWALTADHLLMILDAEDGVRFEVYELRRRR